MKLLHPDNALAVEKLEEKVSKQTEWRKRELTTIRFLIASSDGADRDFMTRAGITFLYAHWEGWAKQVGRLYIEFVEKQKRPLNELSAEFVAAVLVKHVKSLGESNSPTQHKAFINYLIDESDQVHKIPKVFIDNESNLSSKAIERILSGLGISSLFSLGTKENLIDEKLKEVRNAIAHGEYRKVEPEQFDEVYYPVLELLEEYTSAILTAAAGASYLRA